ncbi:hypothetical protein P280DRAFT_513799 [Massarina eburnea CBS 473.64]|uniref:Zn(2)-C6 fungal-type domain-containing protein n=1 Tax=Massarina eburnea CBS 473.64 TaxID=1395130 RepID=A0A6A6SI52_9PLEO|nr:hypothetical protein P280DRAFT_513799 [Massarina eburnea CBS 473.64]
MHWLITGCSSGLGLSLSRAVASLPNQKLTATSRNPSSSVDAVKEITSHSNASWEPLDVSSPDLESQLATIISKHGPIDVLINNAGYAIGGPLEATPLDLIRQQYETNFFGVVRTIQAVLPYMREQGKDKTGVIVNVSSAEIWNPHPGTSVYSSSKFAVDGLTAALVSELAPFNVRMLLAQPGGMRTSFLRPDKVAMQVVDFPASYKGTPAEAVLGFITRGGGADLDPEKAAKAIVEEILEPTMVGEGKRLLRLPLGVSMVFSMISNGKNRSALTEGLSAQGDWEDLVAWDGELYDPLFNDAEITSTRYEGDSTFKVDIQATGSSNFGYFYTQSSTPSIVEGPLSNYAISAPPSVAEGPSPFDHGQSSWLSGSPSYTTTATSPLMDRGGMAYSGSFDVSEDMLSSPSHDTQSFGSSSSYQTAPASTIFNPYLTGSPYAFSRLDVSASQALKNVGTWAEPSLQNQDGVYRGQTFETIPEVEHDGAIPIPGIPRGSPQSLSSTFSSAQWEPASSQEHQQPQPRQTLPRAIAIPLSQAQGQRAPPPLLSVSPDTRRLPRSVLSRSTSKSEPRRSRNKLTSPSPTSNEFGWVSYQPNAHTNKLVPSTDGSRGRRSRGRIGALTLEQRTHAALMRRAGSCYNCRKRKERCDPGTPCQNCLDYFKGDLVNHPCRETRISDLCNAFLSERLGWHPTERLIDSFVGHRNYHISLDFTYHIPLSFGFGPPLVLPVHAINVEDELPLCHDHIVYSWPPSTTCFSKHKNAVLPAVLTPEARFSLQETLNNHLALLVQHHFQQFPLYRSPLRILRDIYILYRTQPPNSPPSRLLNQALKLLVLVHVGGDITLPQPLPDTILATLINTTMPLSEPVTPTPCFIRSQFGSIMPSLALSLLREVLHSLEQLFLNRDSNDWPIALATLLVVLITVESIQYHSAKLPYHHSYDAGTSQSRQESDSRADDEGVKTLLAFYAACFSACHGGLGAGRNVEGRGGDGGLGMSAEDRFVESLREAVVKASPGGYLERKAEARRVGDDMAFFFDRLAARLLVLKA